MTVASIILTYDSPDTVVQCVRLSLAQTRVPDEVLVVDNASPRPAREVLDEAGVDDGRVTVLRTASNLGPAGGYAAGLEWLRDSAHDAGWVMDDDCLPHEDALEALATRAAAESGPTVVFPEEIDGLDGSTLNNPSWSGVWIPRSVVQQVGLPRAEFFWWLEDTEYLRLRMKEAGVPVVREPTARVDQGRARRVGDVPVWKIYYETRNSIYVRLHVRKRARLGRWAWRTLARFVSLVVRGDMRLAKLGAFGQGLVDGARGRLGKRFPV